MEHKNFDLQPTLLGANLKLRPLQLADFETVFHAAADPLIWEQHPQQDRYKQEVFQKYFDGALKSQGALVVERNGQVVGCSRYYDYDAQNSQIAIGYTFLARSEWGGSTNRELKNLMLRHIFQSVDKVVFHIGESNYRSQKGTQKIGAKLSGETLLDGKPHLIFTIHRGDFEKQLLK